MTFSDPESRAAGPVAFLDSGVGGLPYLAAARCLLPDERYVYLADRAGFPYGRKTPAEVRACAMAAVRALVRATAPKALVVACNTATELAIDAIREAHPDLPVIGTVPAIKPAAALSAAKRIAVLATPGAAAAPYLLDLARRWAPDCAVERIGDGDLVDFVENRLVAADAAGRLAAIRPALDAALASGADVIVLGCTHFIHLKSDFAAAAGPSVRVIDSVDGVVAQLRRVLERGPGLAAQRTGAPDARGAEGDTRGAEGDTMYLTGDGEFGSPYTEFADRFGLVPAGALAT